MQMGGRREAGLMMAGSFSDSMQAHEKATAVMDVAARHQSK